VRVDERHQEFDIAGPGVLLHPVSFADDQGLRGPECVNDIETPGVISLASKRV
jgi:hypothetical protein